MMECICEILVGGSTWSSQICRHQNFLGGGLFWSTHTHTQDRLDKSRSALADARLKKTVAIVLCEQVLM